MPKRGKTLKLVAKRLNIKKSGKVLRRLMGQGHNKAKMPGDLIRIKRTKEDASKHPLIKKAIGKMYYRKS